MTAAGSIDALRDGVKHLSAEAAGLVSVMVVRQPEMMGLLAAAARGDREAYMLIAAVTSALSRINTAPRRLPMLCVSCPRPLRHGRYAFGVVMPECDDPTRMLALAVCWRCATDVDGIKAHAVSGLRRIWPDLRPVTVTHPAGCRA